MKNHLFIVLAVASFFGGLSPAFPARNITAAELASFLGISSWETKVELPPNSYSIEICPFEDGKIGQGLFRDQVDWSKDPEGKVTIIAGPEGDNYRFTISSKTAGTFGTTPRISRFDMTYTPSLPDTVSEGVFILLAEPRKGDGTAPQNDPASYKRGFVLKITKKN